MSSRWGLFLREKLRLPGKGVLGVGHSPSPHPLPPLISHGSSEESRAPRPNGNHIQPKGASGWQQMGQTEL